MSDDVYTALRVKLKRRAHELWPEAVARDSEAFMESDAFLFERAYYALLDLTERNQFLERELDLCKLQHGPLEGRR